LTDAAKVNGQSTLRSLAEDRGYAELPLAEDRGYAELLCMLVLVNGQSGLAQLLTAAAKVIGQSTLSSATEKRITVHLAPDSDFHAVADESTSQSPATTSETAHHSTR